jgi:hypothetical protein
MAISAIQTYGFQMILADTATIYDANGAFMSRAINEYSRNAQGRIDSITIRYNDGSIQTGTFSYNNLGKVSFAYHDGILGMANFYDYLGHDSLQLAYDDQGLVSDIRKVAHIQPSGARVDSTFSSGILSSIITYDSGEYMLQQFTYLNGLRQYRTDYVYDSLKRISSYTTYDLKSNAVFIRAIFGYSGSGSACTQHNLSKLTQMTPASHARVNFNLMGRRIYEFNKNKTTLNGLLISSERAKAVGNIKQ